LRSRSLIGGINGGNRLGFLVGLAICQLKVTLPQEMGPQP